MPPMFDPRRIALLLVPLWLTMASVRGELNAQELPFREDNSLQLVELAARSFKINDKEGAASLLLMAQARKEIDREVYPPIGTGGDSPTLPVYALISMMSKPIMESVRNDPQVAKEVLEKLKGWSPKFSENYEPGWKYTRMVDRERLDEIVEKHKQAVLKPVLNQVKLFSDPRYEEAMEKVSKFEEIEQQYQDTRRSADSIEAMPAEVKQRYESAKHDRDVSLEVIWQVKWQFFPESRWHNRVGWKAEDYFTDAQVIKLCRAIADNDLAEMRRLIEAGADVQAVGKHGMTPLLWSFPDRMIDRFVLLLKEGADPNVTIHHDFGAQTKSWHPHPLGESTFYHNRGLQPGQSVTLLAANSTITDYFVAVMAHGGDANYTDPTSRKTLLRTVLEPRMPDAEQRVQILLDHHVDLAIDPKVPRSSPLSEAIAHYHFGAAHLLLDTGEIDLSQYPPSKLAHLARQTVENEERHSSRDGEYKRLLQRIEEQIPQQIEKARKLREQKERKREQEFERLKKARRRQMRFPVDST